MRSLWMLAGDRHYVQTISGSPRNAGVCGWPGLMPVHGVLRRLGRESTSTDFPTTSGSFQTTPRGNGDAFVSKIGSGPPACEVTALLPGPPTQLQVAIHADRGLSSVLTTQATNTTVAVAPFAQ